MEGATREKWDLERMREHRNDWSLAADIQLFSYMQQFSQNLLSETHNTLKALDSFESDIATACVEVGNVGNRFCALSNTQFVENRVYDDEEVTSPSAPTSPQDCQPQENEAVVIQRLREAIQNGIQVLDTKFETVQVQTSESDEEDHDSPHSGVILKPVNRYKNRRLPHLIGSDEFRTDDTLGLRDAPSDEETDDFMSASDKENESESMEESEDSDIESDQTKTVFHQNIFDPQNVKLPGLENVQTNSNIPSPPSGGVFGEQDDDIFSQMAQKKPMFTSWQPSNLWAPEQEDEKLSGDDPSNNRPPSATSSVSSVQSSNVSDSMKKTSEDFGKSGTGREAVLVQEDQDDLFHSKASETPFQPKEFVPAGGVKIFGGDFNPFPNRTHFNEDSASAPEDNRSENDDDALFAKERSVPTKVLPTVPVSNVFTKKKEVSLFDDEEEDDLFSTKSSKPKTTPQSASVSSSVTSLGFNRNDPKDDDLFSNNSFFAESESKLSHSLFKDDLFSDESEDLFSTVVGNKPKNKISTSVSQNLSSSLFSNQGLLENDKEIRSKVSPQKPKLQNLNENKLGDEDSLFENITNSVDNDLFGGDSSKTKPTTSLLANKGQTKSQSSSSFKGDIFADSDNENGLFGSSHKSSKPNQNPLEKDDSLMGNNKTALTTVRKEAGKSDLFSAQKTSNMKPQNVKGNPSVLKHKKESEKHSLFNSDSDDDLFSSPQGSLSSRKSFQSTNAPTESNEKDDKKKSSKFLSQSRTPKTDFSSIFSDDQVETNTMAREETNNSNNVFGDDVGLFSNSSVSVKTPELFNKLLSKPEVAPKKDSSQVSNEENRKIGKWKESEHVESEKVIESINNPIISADQKPPVLSVPLETNIFSDSPPENEGKPELAKKPNPPKTLDIKPIIETLQDNKEEPESMKNEVVIKKPPVPQKVSPKVSDGIPAQSDAPDGEVLSPPTPSKSVPGKLKASQLISINTAALLPGARPSKSDPQLSSSSRPISPPNPVPVLPALQSSAIQQNTLDMPPKSSPLQSINKERVKIQGRRRPSTRRARQEALRASSLDMSSEVESERVSVPSEASTLMSPSTDEEDLFSVPPLDIVYNEKPVSSSTDIFGTTTVLSPVTNKELSSSFVSTPFASSQPPPLDDEPEDGNQGDDLFEPQSNLLASLTEKKPLEVKKEFEPTKGNAGEDLFGDVVDDGFFGGIREAPPPLVDDDDDDYEDEYDELFMPRKRKEPSSSKISQSGSVISVLESLPREDHLFSIPSHSTISSSNIPSSGAPHSQSFEDNNLFSSPDSSKHSSNSLFTSVNEPSHLIPNDPTFKPSTKHSTTIFEDSIFSDDNYSKQSSGGYSGVEDSLFQSTKEGTFLAKQSKVMSSESLSASDETVSIKSKAHESVAFEDELFGNLKLGVSGAHLTDSSEHTVKSEDEIKPKKESLFGEEEEDDVGNLFSSVPEKKGKVRRSLKSSLFGDEDDDDGIFGYLSSSKQADAKAAPVASDTSKGLPSKATKTGSTGSSKPVKLETKQTFSDPLSSLKDHD